MLLRHKTRPQRAKGVRRYGLVIAVACKFAARKAILTGTLQTSMKTLERLFAKDLTADGSFKQD